MNTANNPVMNIIRKIRSDFKKLKFLLRENNTLSADERMIRLIIRNTLDKITLRSLLK